MIAENLQKLREAAAARDWKAYYVILPALLAFLPAADAVEFALAQLRAYLPRFERYHPDVVWPRRRLRKLSMSGPEYMTIQKQPWLPEARYEYRTPGSDHFVQAIGRAWQAAVNVGEPDVCIPHVVAATGSVRIADLEEFWYGPRPGRWDDWVLACKTPISEGDTGRHTVWKVGIIFERDPETQRRDTAAWMAVADELERRIKQNKN
jgi:hypothetical protein